MDRSDEEFCHKCLFDIERQVFNVKELVELSSLSV